MCHFSVSEEKYYTGQFKLHFLVDVYKVHYKKEGQLNLCELLALKDPLLLLVLQEDILLN